MTIYEPVKQLEEEDKVINASPALMKIVFQHLNHNAKRNFTVGKPHPHQANETNDNSFNTLERDLR